MPGTMYVTGSGFPPWARPSQLFFNNGRKLFFNNEKNCSSITEYQK